MDDPSKKRRLPFALDPDPWDAPPGGSVAVSTAFQFSSRSRQRMGRGSVGGDYTSRKGSSAASLADCDRKFERVTPTS